MDGVPVGEILYERPGDDSSRSRLLLKLLVTTQQLSIQVHPDDAYAHSIGLPRGKTEAWYVLSAAPGAKVGVGLKKTISSPQLAHAIADGSIADLIEWRSVVQGDVVLVPAGTIHTIGPALAIAEIQQQSDATFRVFDFGRGRELHVADAIAAAHLGTVKAAPAPLLFSDARTLLVVDPQFVFEKIELLPDSHWSFRAEKETWLFALHGCAQIGPFETSTGDAILVEDDEVRIDVSEQGLKCLAAYPGPAPASDLLKRVPAADAMNSPRALARQPSLTVVSSTQQETRT